MKKVLITGATGQIGRCIAQRFLQEGHQVVLHGSSENSLDKLCNSEKLFSEKILKFPLSADEIFLNPTVIEFFSGVDILINAVGGGGRHETWQDTSLKKWEDIYKINVLLPVFFINNFLRNIEGKRYGRIINISSVSALKPLEIGPEYSAAKAALVNLSESLAKELKNTGVTVNCISPGLVFTNSLRQYLLSKFSMSPGADDEAIISEFVANKIFPTITGSLPTPSDIAGLIWHLCSAASANITGQNFVIDSGYTLSDYAIAL